MNGMRAGISATVGREERSPKIEPTGPELLQRLDGRPPLDIDRRQAVRPDGPPMVRTAYTTVYRWADILVLVITERPPTTRS